MDELQIIIAMIERQMYDYNLKADIGSTGEVFDEKVEDAKYQVCKDILSFVKSLQKNSVSDDLEEASCNYRYNFFGHLAERGHRNTSGNAMKNVENHFKAGARWQKRQMMKNAVDGVVHHYGDDEIAAIHYNDPKGVPMSYFVSSKGLNAGDNVKLITVKEG